MSTNPFLQSIWFDSIDSIRFDWFDSIDSIGFDWVHSIESMHKLHKLFVFLSGQKYEKVVKIDHLKNFKCIHLGPWARLSNSECIFESLGLCNNQFIEWFAVFESKKIAYLLVVGGQSRSNVYTRWSQFDRANTLKVLKTQKAIYLGPWAR